MTIANPRDSEAAGHPDPARRPLAEHLAELRRRLLWSFVLLGVATGICFYFAQDIYGFLVRPLADAMGPESTQRLIYTGLTEAFFTYIKVAFFAAFFLTFPFIAIQLWRFVAPGLYVRERRAFLPFLVATPVLSFAGGAFVYFLVMPMAWRFFLKFQTTGMETILPIQLEPRVGEYLDIVLTLVVAFAVCFQLPVLLGILGRAGMVTADMLCRARRYAIVGFFVVAGVLTPPDVLSQCLLAVPLMALYEVTIVFLRRMEVSRRDPARAL